MHVVRAPMRTHLVSISHSLSLCVAYTQVYTTPQALLSPPLSTRDTLKQAVGAWEQDTDNTKARVSVLLGHHYTEANLSFDKLKVS